MRRMAMHLKSVLRVGIVTACCYSCSLVGMPTAWAQQDISASGSISLYMPEQGTVYSLSDPAGIPQVVVSANATATAQFNLLPVLTQSWLYAEAEAVADCDSQPTPGATRQSEHSRSDITDTIGAYGDTTTYAYAYSARSANDLGLGSHTAYGRVWASSKAEKYDPNGMLPINPYLYGPESDERTISYTIVQ